METDIICIYMDSCPWRLLEIVYLANRSLDTDSTDTAGRNMASDHWFGERMCWVVVSLADVLPSKNVGYHAVCSDSSPTTRS